jgi:hypothetical protein
MADEAAIKMYESARDRLAELIRQEIAAKEQIEQWAPVVERLAGIAGATLPEEIDARIAALKSVKDALSPPEDVEDMGLTEAIRWLFRQRGPIPLTPTQVRDELATIGYDLSKYTHVMPPIHVTLRRMKDAGEIEEVPHPMGRLGARAFRTSK